MADQNTAGLKMGECQEELILTKCMYNQKLIRLKIAKIDN